MKTITTWMFAAALVIGTSAFAAEDKSESTTTGKDSVTTPDKAVHPEKKKLKKATKERNANAATPATPAVAADTSVGTTATTPATPAIPSAKSATNPDAAMGGGGASSR